MQYKTFQKILKDVDNKNYLVVESSRDLGIFFYDYLFISTSLSAKSNNFRKLIVTKTISLIEHFSPSVAQNVSTVYYLMNLGNFKNKSYHRCYCFFLSLFFLLECLHKMNTTRSDFPKKYVRAAKLLTFEQSVLEEANLAFRLEKQSYICGNILETMIFLNRNKNNSMKEGLQKLSQQLRVGGLVPELLKNNLTILLED